MLFTKSRLAGRRVGLSLRRVSGGPKATTKRYRLYADGTIIDQEIGKPAGYIVKDLDEVYRMRGRELQNYLKKFLEE